MKNLFFLLVSLFLINASFSTDCPKDLINDSYPGSCGLYVDTNNDSFCDLSQDASVFAQSTSNNEAVNLSIFDELAKINWFFPILALVLSIAFPYIFKIFIKKINLVNLITDLLMIVLSIVLFITSILKWFFSSTALISIIHDYFGMILSGLVLSHVLLHWNWLKTMIFKKR